MLCWVGTVESARIENARSLRCAHLTGSLVNTVTGVSIDAIGAMGLPSTSTSSTSTVSISTDGLGLAISVRSPASMPRSTVIAAPARMP